MRCNIVFGIATGFCWSWFALFLIKLKLYNYITFSCKCVWGFFLSSSSRTRVYKWEICREQKPQANVENAIPNIHVFDVMKIDGMKVFGV